MSGIAMGTTPTIRIKIQELDFDLVKEGSFTVYFQQDGGIIITMTESDVYVNLEEKTIETYLSQVDTLDLNPNKPLRIEVRWLFNDTLPNGEYKAGKTNIFEVPVTKTLKREVIKYEE